ncbi:hypothetical protein L228DRAFT_258757 [Xylona heveae TC161]|uniref:Metallo-beta-lactamase domain-containing protein n=1 Tax=Xylona heveae (strain CBS 132557 / TC161) TaxID=1328760 RepID=A0A165ISA9_XYLHT|nr:hypothetical protein L228DRAFT_258757 [Xylona heveae TC161]KZF25313.1 hypothetical protein L228DRAFT_258757 [Xylona heveae TC161]
MASSNDSFLICFTCGTQFDTTDRNALKSCRICDDPRQFVPPSGQSFTTLADIRKDRYKNKREQYSEDNRIWFIWTEPKFAIGQRAILLQTPSGNVLWDLITYLDDDTAEFIDSIGGLRAIVISHPHYYTTHVEWAQRFQCPVYLALEDKKWINCTEGGQKYRRFIDQQREEIVEGVTAIKTGGHFDGSMVMHWEDKLLIADTFVTVPSALYHINRVPGTTSYSFMWSIPNMIPLPPLEIEKIWGALKPFEFNTTLGAFMGMNVRGRDVKARVLESMKIQIKAEGHPEHAFLSETWP